MGERRETVDAWCRGVLLALAALGAIHAFYSGTLDRRLTALEAAQKGEQK